MTQLALPIPELTPAPAIVPETIAPAAVPPPAAPAAIVPPGAVAPPAYDPQIQAELEYYRRRAAEGELQAKAMTYRQQLEGDGWPSELAAVQAKTWFDKESMQARLAATEAEQERSAKFTVASRLATQYGLTPDILLAYPTPNAMVAAAQRLGGDAKRIAALEAEVAALRGGAVPAQTFSDGRGAAGNPADAYTNVLRSGGKLPTAAEIDRLTAQYLQG